MSLWPRFLVHPVYIRARGVAKVNFAALARIQSCTYIDSDVISMPAGFHRHLVGKTLRPMCFFTVILLKYALSSIIQTFSETNGLNVI